jgi:hypothetical protein
MTDFEIAVNWHDEIKHPHVAIWGPYLTESEDVPISAKKCSDPKSSKVISTKNLPSKLQVKQ